MIKIIFACLLLALGLWGCDDNGGRRAICNQLPQVQNFPECPAEAFMQPRVCPPFCAIGEGRGMPDALEFQVLLDTCEFPDCFTANCQIREFDDDPFLENPIRDAVFLNLESFPMGLISIDGGEPMEYNDCTFLQP